MRTSVLRGDSWFEMYTLYKTHQGLERLLSDTNSRRGLRSVI